MHPAIAERIFRLGAARRNPSLFTTYERLKASEFLPRKDLESIQLENARRFLQFAGRYSPYMAEVFASSGFDPSTFDDLDLLRQVPVTTKSTLLSENDRVHADHPFPKALLAETSGTTGEALEFRKDEEWDSAVRATLMRSYDWYDVKLWHRNAYLWGFNIAGLAAAKVRALDLLQNRHRLFSYEKERLARYLDQIRDVRFIGGYSSMIYELARASQDLGLGPQDFPNLRLVKGTSETILDVHRKTAQEVFGRPMRSEYGAAETGLVAFECPAGHMHINIENVIVEHDPDDGLIITNLLSRSFPVVRYAIGDQAELDEVTVCDCGRNHPILRNLVGRKGGVVRGNEDTYPALTFYYVFKNLAMGRGLYLNYAAHQREVGTCDLRIEQALEPSERAALDKELEKYFDADVGFRIMTSSPLDLGGKKRQYFTSDLD